MGDHGPHPEDAPTDHDGGDQDQGGVMSGGEPDHGVTVKVVSTLLSLLTCPVSTRHRQPDSLSVLSARGHSGAGQGLVSHNYSPSLLKLLTLTTYC